MSGRMQRREEDAGAAPVMDKNILSSGGTLGALPGSSEGDFESSKAPPLKWD